MVKADAKRDYYADLELPATADAEEIKKQFRALAKQYHPDRNPGREVEVLAKFQAVQAAHEILSDPQQKAKYDADRARLNRPNKSSFSANDTDPYPFRKPPMPKQPPPPTATNPFPPPPPRNRTQRPAFDVGGRGKPPPPSPGAEKFNAFTRPQSQTWDRAKFDEAARADAARGFAAMRSSQNTPQPQGPPRPPRHPTAPKSFGENSSPETPLRPGPQQNFPGMARTANTFAPGSTNGTPAGGDGPGQRTSAYGYFYGERPQSHQYHPDPGPSPSSPNSKTRPAVNLRHVRSTGVEDARSHRPDLERTSSRYAAPGGERTDLRGTRAGRSASVRNSPVDRPWEGAKVEELHRHHSHHDVPPPPRHRSHSPKPKPVHIEVEMSSSDSESSVDDRRSHMGTRPKLQPRRPRPKSEFNPAWDSPRTNPQNGPALTGHFPNTNYTKLVDESQYKYPAPETRDGPVRRPFPNMTTPVQEGPPGMNGHSRGDGGKSDNRGPNSAGTQPPPYGAGSPLNPHNVSQESVGSIFSAADWDGKFTSGDEYLRPTESQGRGRKSPSKTTRMRARSLGKERTSNQDEQQESEGPPNRPDIETPISPGRDRSATVNTAEPSKSAAFQNGKFSADEWAEKLRDQKWAVPNTDLNKARPLKRGSKSNERTKNPPPLFHELQEEEAVSPTHPVLPPDGQTHTHDPDAMDIDEDATATVGNPKQPAPTGPESPLQEHGKDPEAGVDLRDLSKTAPLAPSATGLKDLDDLAATLPFPSQPAYGVKLEQSASSSVRRLDLPRPPNPVIAPLEDGITQERWERYVADMYAYSHDWNVFNIKMIDHFHGRQDQINLGMGKHWISSVGDGPSADEFDAARGDGPRAGYATYMSWLKDDALCRAWWDEANDRHRKCFEDLGKVRLKVKAAAGVV